MTRLCEIEGCGNTHTAKGMCNVHYQRQWKIVNIPFYLSFIERKFRLCKIEGCDRGHKAKGMCYAHYQRQRRGIPLDEVPINGYAKYPTKECTVGDCTRINQSEWGYCSVHASRYKKHGDALVSIPIGQRSGFRPDLAPKCDLTTTELYWAAGFYEGEGTVSGAHGTVSLSVTQKEKGPLQRMRNLFGGTVSTAGSREMWQWFITAARAIGCIQTMYGLLSDRRQLQAREALQIGEFRK